MRSLEGLTLIDKARAVSIAAHQAVGQFRKYTGEPYWHHPMRVAQTINDRFWSAEMTSAAWLHDVVEDTQMTFEDLHYIFPAEVVDLVRELTNERPPGLNRAMRKALDRNRLVNVSARAQNIKLADIIDNAPSIFEHDPEFAKVWFPEQHQLVPLLNRGDAVLWQMAREAVLLS